MRQSKEIKILLQNEVQDLLEKNELARDSDRLLSALIWAKQLKDINTAKTYLVDFLSLYITEKLYSEQSIARCRRRIQEINTHLRGSLYAERHKEQTEVINNLKK